MQKKRVAPRRIAKLFNTENENMIEEKDLEIQIKYTIRKN